MGCGVTEGADVERTNRGMMDQEQASFLMPWIYLCLINIPPALCNNGIHAFNSHILSRFDSVLSTHINEMKENHHSENKPQTTWLNV